jgi:hypothetical protein
MSRTRIRTASVRTPEAPRARGSATVARAVASASSDRPGWWDGDTSRLVFEAVPLFLHLLRSVADVCTLDPSDFGLVAHSPVLRSQPLAFVAHRSRIARQLTNVRLGTRVAVGAAAVPPPALEKRLERLLGSNEGGSISVIDAAAGNNPGHVEVFRIERAPELLPFERRGDESRRREPVRSNDRRSASVARGVQENAPTPARGARVAAEQLRLEAEGAVHDGVRGEARVLE